MIQLITKFKAFHFVISKMNFSIQEVISSDSLHQFLISNTPLTLKWSRRSRNQVIQGLNCLNSSIFFKHPRTSLSWFSIYGEIGRDRWMRLFIFDEWLRFNADSQIIVFKSRLFDFHRTVKMNPRVHWGAFNLDCYNSSNERLILNHLNMNRCQIKCSHVPPRVSEIWWLWLNCMIGCFSLRDVTSKLKWKQIVPRDINLEFLGVFKVLEINGFA